MTNFDDMKFAVEAMTGGTNTVILDDLGLPSIMVVIPKMYSSDLISGASETVHPAFIVDGIEKDKVYVSKYLNIVANNRAYSLPMQEPRINVTADQSRTYCRNKGNGWGLMPASLWGAVALWSKKNGTTPHGNNNYGKDIIYAHECGVQTSSVTVEGVAKTARTATGSGPATWYHDHTKNGIADLNGNIWERCDGMRILNAEIQIIPYANSILPNTDMSATSTQWKAIFQDGSLTTPGTNDTLKYDYVNNKWTVSTSLTSQSATVRASAFQDVTAESGLEVPQILKELALYPADSDGYEDDQVYITNDTAERLMVRGGAWNALEGSGIFFLYLSNARSTSREYMGFRSAYYEI